MTCFLEPSTLLLHGVEPQRPCVHRLPTPPCPLPLPLLSLTCSLGTGTCAEIGLDSVLALAPW